MSVVSTPQSLWFLENVNLTEVLCPIKLGQGGLDKHPRRKFARGEYIFVPNDHADRLYFIMHGRVKIGHYGDGHKEVIKTILQEGELFGEMALVSETRRRDFAQAMEDTEVCVLGIDDAKDLMRNYTGLSLFFFRTFGSRMLEMERRLESLVFKDSRTRIIEYLLEITRHKGRRIGYEYEVKRFLTHQDIANLTATSRQTVTTVLNELRDKNLISFNRKRLLVRDLDALQREAESMLKVSK